MINWTADMLADQNDKSVNKLEAVTVSKRKQKFWFHNIPQYSTIEYTESKNRNLELPEH